MRRLLALLTALLAGLVGLALVFTDYGPGRTEAARAWVGGGFYVAAGLLVGLIHARGRALRWAVVTAWGMVVLGLVGVWVSATDSASGDWSLALLYLLGPLACALLGIKLGSAIAR